MLDGVISIGMLYTFTEYISQLFTPVQELAEQFTTLQSAIASAEKIFTLLDEKPMLSDKEDAKKLPAVRGKIEFDHVWFAYDNVNWVLKDVSFTIEPGQKVAFVGATGAGKTTITNLINRFYDISDGKIRYDGINIQKIRKSDLRRSLGIVLQDTHLFTGTVMENIRYGRLDASDEECIAAAKLANANGFIQRLPDGYNTMLTGDGANLSQGQRQLLAIARAAVADPPVLILDEATSSIDTRTEKLVQDGMDGLMYGRTTFVIAHRLSTVRTADQIIVLENGRIVQRGNHKELMREDGLYRRFVGMRSQAIGWTLKGGKAHG